MGKQEIRTDKAPQPAGAYSQAIEAGGFVFTAGMGGFHPETGELPPTVGEQTSQALKNLAAVLAESGLTLNDVAKATVHLQDVKTDFAEYNEVYESAFEPPYPVRTTVGSDLLGGMLVEIDLVAKRSD